MTRVAAGIIRNDGKYLLLSHAKNYCKWALPVGKFKDFENGFDALKENYLRR